MDDSLQGVNEETRARIQADIAERDTPPQLHPENVKAVEVFISVQTQWRVSIGGVTGLDYTALHHAMSMMGVRRRDRRDLFDRVRIMELAALDTQRR